MSQLADEGFVPMSSAGEIPLLWNVTFGDKDAL